MKSRREETEKTMQLLRSSEDFDLVTIKECEFRAAVEADQDLKMFHDNWDPTFALHRGRKLSQSDVQSAIKSGTLFGVGVISVKVPSTWEGTGFYHPLSPREFFQVFPPVFQNREVSFKDIGPFMQSCIRQRQLNEKAVAIAKLGIRRSQREGRVLDLRAVAREVRRIKFKEPPPQRLLVSVMNSERLVVTGDLICWYMSHGLTVFVEEFIQYKPAACFLPFVKTVTKARQSANEIHGRGMKLLGNSARSNTRLF